MNEHQSVLLHETLAALAIQPDGVYLDATFGRGGHSAAILAQLGSGGRLFAADRDPDAIKAASSDKRFDDPRFCIQQRSFTELHDYMSEQGMLDKVNGILFDLGVSSPQLDNPERGFSFLRDGPLDMRMNPAVGLSAAEWLAQIEEAELCAVLKEYGEERYAKRIARAIVHAREQTPIVRTSQLAEIVSAAHPHWERHKHPATRVFQAIRIAVNDELNQLESVLQHCIEVLAVGGRLAVISFHSLEDRSIKNFIQKQLKGGDFPRHLPIREAQRNIRLRRIINGIKPSAEEIASNTRAQRNFTSGGENFMNTATRIVTHQHVEEAANTLFAAPVHFGFGTAFLAILVLLSALTVVYLSDLNRRLFIQFQDTQATHNQLYVEWGKLLLEQSTWSTQARVQEIAQQRLGLELPAANAVVMIKKPV